MGSNANFDGRNTAARYQLSIAVTASFLAHDSLYRSRSESEKIPGGEVFRNTRTSGDLEELLSDPDLEAVAIATPVPTHAALAQRVLAAGKHCFVEKPVAQSVVDAEQVAAAAAEAGRILMVGHLLEYHPGVQTLKDIADSGDLGDLHYLYSNRLNLGKLRADENALWSLGAHDVSVVLLLAREEPSDVMAFGESYMHPGIEDVVFCYLRFPSGLAAHMHLSWLDPHKERRLTVVGSQRMATFDDMELQDYASFGEYIARSGDIWSPRVPSEEPLRVECQHFAECVRTGTEPRSGGAGGIRVVRVLEALQESLDRRSAAVR